MPEEKPWRRDDVSEPEERSFESLPEVSKHFKELSVEAYDLCESYNKQVTTGTIFYRSYNMESRIIGTTLGVLYLCSLVLAIIGYVAGHPLRLVVTNFVVIAILYILLYWLKYFLLKVLAHRYMRVARALERLGYALLGVSTKYR